MLGAWRIWIKKGFGILKCWVHGGLERNMPHGRWNVEPNGNIKAT